MYSEHPLFQEESSAWTHDLIAASRLFALTQEIFDVFWILTPSGKRQAISSSWKTFADQQEETYAGQGWLDAIHPMDRQQGEDTLHQTISSGHSSELVCHIRGYDNSYHLVHLRLIPVREASGTIGEVLACGNNLTKQMQTEQMSEAQVQLALKASGVGMWDWNLITDELIWTDQKRALFGLSPEIPISDARFLEALHPDDRERTRQRNMQAIAEKKEYNKDYRTIWPDGSVHWLTDRAQVICNEAGQPTHIVGATLDITERKHKEEELQATKDEISTILESITDAFLCLDSEWRYSYLNQRMETYLGKKREEVLGKCMWEVVPVLLGTTFEHHYRTAMATQQATHFEAFHPAFQRWVETYVYPKSGGLSIYFHDISERKQIEEALRESEARFQRLRESNIIGITITDMEGNILEANDAFLSLIGYTRDDMEAGPIKWAIITPPQTRARDTEAIEEALRTGVAQPYEKEYISKDGKRVPVLIGRALFRREGLPPLFLCFALDQTARKEMEKQKDLFLGITGHELRTPLAALRGTLQLIERRLRRVINKTDDLSPEMVSFFEGMQKNLANGVRQVDIQTRLINDLLDISRITSGTLKLSLKHCDLVSIIRETVEDLRLANPERQFLLELPEDTPVNVLADQNRISQVITNYVTNAIRYSNSDQPVHIGLIVQENMARVWVRDHGPGLSKEAQEKVWRCFHQVKEVPVQSGSEKGLGLGLYICQTLIEQHHGEVDVESTPGQGSTFWFSLPLANSQESA